MRQRKVRLAVQTVVCPGLPGNVVEDPVFFVEGLVEMFIKKDFSPVFRFVKAVFRQKFRVDFGH